MSQLPETRASLIQRLPNAADDDAWQTFTEIYEPLLFRLARSRGLQSADAEDFVQEVLKAVAGSVNRWLENNDRGPFRAWLFRIAGNLAVNFLTRPRHRGIGTGDSQMKQFLEMQPVAAQDSGELFASEYRRELFRWAAEQVRATVPANGWLAFWWTTVGGRPIAEVATELGMSVGAVYIARSRITRRITDVINRHKELTQ